MSMIQEEYPHELQEITAQQLKRYPLAENVFNKLSKWVTSHSVTIESFWDSSAVAIPLSELERMFGQAKLQVTQEEKAEMRALFAGNRVLNINTLFSLMKSWRQNPSLLV
jgi:hypothetical protein